jgi:molecular chaperone HscB
MNYFELFDLPVQLKVDKAAVRKKYLDLSRQSHPDYFINEGTDEQQRVLETSASLNKALKTLTNEDELIKYVLTEKELLEKDEKYVLPASFLMEMMEFNESIAELQFGEDSNVEKLKEGLDTLQGDIYGSVKEVIENYKEGITTKEELLQVKEYYFKKKYLERLRHQLDQKL